MLDKFIGKYSIEFLNHEILKYKRNIILCLKNEIISYLRNYDFKQNKFKRTHQKTYKSLNRFCMIK